MAVMRTHRAISVFIITLLTGASFGRSSVLGQEPDVAKGAAVLAEARKALGGEEKLAAVKTLQVNGTSRRANGNFNLEGDSEIFVELPDKFRRNESLSIGAGGPGIERTEGLNGIEFWTETSGGDFGGRGGRGRFGGGFPGGAPTGAAPADGRAGQPQVDPERLREAQRRNLQSEVSRLLLGMLLFSQTPPAWIGTAQSPDGNADVLEIKTSDGVATRLFIDSTTHMPLMMTWTGPARGAGGRGGAGRGGRGGPDQSAAPPPAPPAGGDAAAAGGGAAPPGAPAADPGQGRRGRGAQGPPVTLEMHLAEYKTVNGIKLPHLITRGAGGETNEEWTIKSYKINPNFKANTFTK
jgi:hypothetical protein